MLKEKNRHLENHMDEILTEFKSMHVLYEKAEAHEKELIKHLADEKNKLKDLDIRFREKESELEITQSDLTRMTKKYEENSKKVK